MSFTTATTYDVLNCFKCGFRFGIPEETVTRWRKNHRWFRCPSCFAEQHFSGESEAERLKREKRYLEITLSGARDRADMHAKSASSYKGHVTRLKNRISKGVCPCCNRTFADLAKHMNSKHPHYAGDTDG